METVKKGYPKAFWVCSFSETFERLAYYLGRSLILIFVTTAVVNGGLGLSDKIGANMQANMTAFSYLAAIFGAVIVDRFIGAKYTTPVGMIITGIGYYVGSIATGIVHIYLMILLVSFGLGLFKNGPLLGRIITDKKQMDSAFSLRYTLVNLGAFIGTFAVGILYKDVFAKNGVLGFSQCFKLAALVMILGALWYFFVCWKYLGEIGSRPFIMEKTQEEIEMEKRENLSEDKNRPLTKMEKKRMGAIVLVSSFSIIFWIFWYLAYLPVYYYWAENMNWVIGGYQVPVTWFDSANALICIALGPVMAAFWMKLSRRPQGDISLFRKTGIGIGILGLSYLFYAFIDITRGDAKASVLWLILFAVFLTLGEMFFSPLGNSFISKYSPSKYLGIMMSVWSIGTFIAAKLYGYAYGFLFGGNFKFTVACNIVAAIAFGASVVLFVMDKKLSALVEE